MCGIAGIYGSRKPQSLAAMLKAMHHRGPDDQGIYQEANIALGMVRLAVIDTSSDGHQPMRNDDGSIWLVYNGETYNFQALRTDLIAKGYSFHSHSDTEVVLKLYEHYGDDFLLKLRGMFALAIYDKRQGVDKARLLLARDHLGIKPLLYYRSGENWLFASELKGLLASGLVTRDIEPEALRLLLTFGSVTQPYTLLKNVYALLPGHRLIIEQGVEKIERYWQLSTERAAQEIQGLTYNDLVSLVRTKLEESVRLQMVSDVPLGAFLSGGVDSAFLSALMARNSQRPIKTFSVGFEAEGYQIDESFDAEKIAQFIESEHNRFVVTGDLVRNHIHRIAVALDQPSVDGVNSYFVSLAARQSVTVAISGTGGDELFAGYPWFISMILASEQERNPSFKQYLKILLAKFARLPWFNGLQQHQKFGLLLEGIRKAHGFLPHYARIHQIFAANGAAQFLNKDLYHGASLGRETSLDVFADELPDAATLERVSALCLRGYTQNQLLRDIDAVSMSHSLEVRVPFLDPVLTDLALALPGNTKVGILKNIPNPETASYRATGTKRILIDASVGLLPPGMDNQPKRGFAMPFSTWLQGSLQDVFTDSLAIDTVKQRGLFDPEAVTILQKSFAAGEASWAQPWLLMMIELWCQQILDVPQKVEY